MTLAMEKLGDRLHTLPDGETGERRNWIIHIVEALRNHPDFEIAREGDWSDYDKTPRFKVVAGKRLSADALSLGHAAAFHANYKTFKALRAKHGLGDLAYQVGIPGDLDLALFVFGPAGIVTRRRPFMEATLREIRAIHAEGGDDVVFQIEVPAELAFVAQMPPPMRPLVASYMASGICRLARLSPAGTRFGIHLCLGDMNHRAIARLTDVGPVVQLANAIGRGWSAGRRLDYIHAPFAAANIPPVLDESWYAPLSKLSLPTGTRFVAGCIHEDLSIDDQQKVIELIERRVGARVDLATACGLGRRERAAAVATMDRIVAVS